MINLVLFVAGISGILYFAGRDDSSRAPVGRQPHTSPIPIPVNLQDPNVIAYRAMICHLGATYQDDLELSHAALNQIYEGSGARWPTVPGDHMSKRRR